MCLCKDGEELPLFTLPLRSFAKHALQKWSYKASISVSGKWWHCNSLLLLLDGVISHRLNIRIDLISQSNLHKSWVKTMDTLLKYNQSKLYSK